MPKSAFSYNVATTLNATLGKAFLVLFFLCICKPDIFKESSKYWPITLLDLNKLKSFIMRNNCPEKTCLKIWEVIVINYNRIGEINSKDRNTCLSSVHLPVPTCWAPVSILINSRPYFTLFPFGGKVYFS